MAVKPQLLGTLLLVLLAFLPGCRQALSPEIGRTHPETWVRLGDAKGTPSAATATHPWELDASAIGTIVTLSRDGSPVLLRHQAFPIEPVIMITGWPRDTVPVGSRLSVKWRPATGSTVVARASTAGGDASVGGAIPDSILTPGVKALTLQVPAHAGGGTANLYFMVNFNPDTWWAGPDPAQWPVSAEGERSVAVSDWTHFTTTPPWPPDGRAYFGPDSFRYLPSARRPVGGDVARRTFYEIYGNRIYARAEGDTVHMNSWVVFVNGGYDRDSKYVPLVDPADPALPAGFAGDPVRYAVLGNQGLAGSPIGFQARVQMRLTPDGIRYMPWQSSMYPDFRPASVFREPHVVGYRAMVQAGKAYALARAQDADGGLDAQIADPIALADRVDAGGGTDVERAARRKIVTFYVDQAPVLLRDESAFTPRDEQSFPSHAGWTFHLIARDPDPYDPLGGNRVGGPGASPVVSFAVTLYGRNTAGRDTAISLPRASATPSPSLGPGAATLALAVPSTVVDLFAAGEIRVSVQVCDCASCKDLPGSGRCVEGIDPATKQVVNPGNVITIRIAAP